MRRSIELDRNHNCVFFLFYHLIIVVKYRQRVFTNNKIIDRIKEIIYLIANKFDVKIVEQGCDEDHIHILFKSKPTLYITKFINNIKGVSSRIIRKEFSDELRNKLWGKHFWSPSYFLVTAGNVRLETLKKYVESQGKK